MHGVAVDQDAIGLDAGVLDGPRHSGPQGLGHTDGVDKRRLDMARAYGDRYVGDSSGENFSLGGGQLLGVVDAPDHRIVRQRNGAHGERAGNRASPDLVDPKYNAVAAELTLKLVHATHACVLSLIALKPFLSAGDGSLNLLSRVVGISLDKSKRLVGRGVGKKGRDFLGG